MSQYTPFTILLAVKIVTLINCSKESDTYEVNYESLKISFSLLQEQLNQSINFHKNNLFYALEGQNNICETKPIIDKYNIRMSLLYEISQYVDLFLEYFLIDDLLSSTEDTNPKMFERPIKLKVHFDLQKINLFYEHSNKSKIDKYRKKYNNVHNVALDIMSLPFNLMLQEIYQSWDKLRIELENIRIIYYKSQS